ncbi:MAG: hypothetical protein HY370_06380 [Proteobacteria bacterium]|nr:hypothetical protein [Pseudomonadota bacterium]
MNAESENTTEEFNEAGEALAELQAWQQMVFAARDLAVDMMVKTSDTPELYRRP